jgi:hydrogenase/urease accessory protein HupE
MSTAARYTRFWLFVLGALSCASRVQAHPLAPVSVVVEEQTAQVYRTEFRRSARALRWIELKLPAHCQRSELRQVTAADGSMRDAFMLRCERSLEGESIAFSGLERAGVGGLVYVAFMNGHSVRGVLSEETPAFVVPPAADDVQVARDYIWLGVEHLLTGYDHLLFVLGLSLLMRGFRRLALTLTAFTLGHSMTLCLATFELVRLPSAPVEVGIALSLVVLALELLTAKAHNVLRAMFVMAFSFGLLHGLGFAGALGEAGLPRHAIPLALFAFNLGVELGQLSVVLLLSPLLMAYWKQGSERARTWRSALGYGIGSLAAMWCIERAAALF